MQQIQPHSPMQQMQEKQVLEHEDVHMVTLHAIVCSAEHAHEPYNHTESHFVAFF